MEILTFYLHTSNAKQWYKRFEDILKYTTQSCKTEVLYPISTNLHQKLNCLTNRFLKKKSCSNIKCSVHEEVQTYKASNHLDIQHS